MPYEVRIIIKDGAVEREFGELSEDAVAEGVCVGWMIAYDYDEYEVSVVEVEE